MIEVNQFVSGEHPPVEFLLALAYEYETEIYDINLVRYVDFQVTPSRDGRVEVRHPRVYQMSSSNASIVRTRFLTYVKELTGDTLAFSKYIKSLGRLNFREVTYMYEVMYKKDLDEMRKEIENIDKRKIERSSNSRRLHSRAISDY